MRFRLIEAAKKVPVKRLCRSSTSVRADTSPGRSARPAADSVTIWCCWLMSARPSPFRTGPTAARAGARTSRQRASSPPALAADARGARARQNRRFNRTTDSVHAFRAPKRRSWTSQRPGRTRSGAPTSRTCGPARAGSTSPSSSTCSPGASSAGQPAIGFTRNWHCRLCAGPSRAAPVAASFTTRTAAANTAPSITRLS